jgi:quinol-cytochrome oxidoreductase complex cytochrome b subunit
MDFFEKHERKIKKFLAWFFILYCILLVVSGIFFGIIGITAMLGMLAFLLFAVAFICLVVVCIKCIME